MKSRPAPTFGELFATAVHSAVHLEMRDAYTPEDPRFQRWLAGEPAPAAEAEAEWAGIVGATLARGVAIRRVRIVSEPLADYPRFELEVAADDNVEIGEQVRWLPRARTADLALPGLDFWLVDEHTLQFHHFAGDGTWLRDEVTDDPDVIRLCTVAFEAAWDRAVPHGQYRPA